MPLPIQYFYNVPTTVRWDWQNTGPSSSESHIAALDLTYDLTANLSVGSNTPPHRTGKPRPRERIFSPIQRSFAVCAWIRVFQRMG